MPKSSNKKIDEDRRKIMLELRKDSRKNIDKLAKACGFSRQKVWRFLKGLEKDKSIWGYTAVLDNERLGLKKYQILIKRTVKPMRDGTARRLVAGGLASDAKEAGVHIESSLYVQGVYDWVIFVVSPSIIEVKKFCEILSGTLVEFISDISILEVLFLARDGNIDNPDPDKFKTLFIP